MIAPLFVGIADPVERLRAEREAMDRLKEQDQAGGLYAMTNFADAIPPALQAFAGLFAGNVPQTLLNTVSTNVPGPQIPLYLAGHQLVNWIPLGICSANIGLFVAILSYNQKLTFGLLVDPTLVPDVWDLAGDLRDSFTEMREVAGRAHAPSFDRVSELATPKPTANGRKEGSRRRAKAGAR